MMPSPYEQQPQYQPMPPQYKPMPQRVEYQSTGISLNMIAGIVVIGIVIFFVGAIICNASIPTETPTDYEAQKTQKKDTRNMYKAGTILADIGALIASIGIFYGALTCKQLENTLKVAMLSVGTTIIVVVLVLMLLGAPYGALGSP